MVSELFQLQGDAFAAEGFLLGPEVDPVQWEICGINSCGEKKMVSSRKIEIEKFNGQSFELWKLKMEDLLVDKY